MRHFLLSLLIVFTSVLLAQKKAFTVGDRVSISVDCYNDMDSKTTILIPDNKYTLVFNYNWGAKDRDGRDSIAKIEAALTRILDLYKISDIRLICFSYDKGDNYQAWLQYVKTAKPFKVRKEVKIEWHNTNDYAEVNKTLHKIFNKVTLIAPDGKVMAESDDNCHEIHEWCKRE